MANLSIPAISEQSADKQQKKTVNVAVAVIHYQDQYLLGYRNSEQHQGDRYEFVGGKIEAEESAMAALIRETQEETAIDISDNVAVKLGRLHHDYGDKQVCLQVYKVALTAKQYQHYKHYDCGLEGQALTWVDKQALLDNHYSLPAANQTILTWLKLPASIAITYPLAHFEQHQQQDGSSVEQSWLQFHQQQLPSQSWSYLRLKVAKLNDEPSKVREGRIAQRLLAARPDIQAIIAYQVGSTSTLCDEADTDTGVKLISANIAAYHLTQAELMTWFQQYQQEAHFESCHSKSFHFQLFESSSQAHIGLIISCHDIESITAANKLASLRLAQGLAPVLAIFLSPVLVTDTHPDSAALGWEQWAALAELADMPVIALGGLAASMQALAASKGAISIAGIRQFLKG